MRGAIFRPGLLGSLCVLPLLLLSACPPSSSGYAPGADGGSDGGRESGGSPGGARYLAIVGNPIVSILAGESTELHVALAQEDLGPVAGETVTFTVQGSGGTVDGGAEAQVTTSEQGAAQVTFTAGDTPTTLQVVVSAPGATPVAFGIEVVRLQHVVRIVRTPGVVVQPSGLQASVETTAFDRVLLRVQVTNQFAEPLEGVEVSFGFQSQPADASLSATRATTSAVGEVTVELDTGTTLDDSFIVTARTDASATASWSVVLQGANITLCSSNQECPIGEFCDGDGVCRGVPGCDPANGVLCPTGYRCQGNECIPAFSASCMGDEDCGTGYTCESGVCTPIEPVCDTNTPCPGGFICQNGTCVPTGNVPDISGTWYTAHVFHIGDALPVVGDIAGPIRTIDRLFLGDLGLPGFIEDLIRSLVDEYVPEWLQDVVHILDAVFTLLSDLRSEGFMTVNQNVAAWTATETWTSFVFYYLDLCDPIPADPTPDCARVDLYVDDPVVAADLGLKIHPFGGTVSETTILVETRQVEMRVAKLVGYLADQLVDWLTPYTTVEEAIVNSVDCASVGQTVENLTGGFLSASTVEGLCNSAVGAAAAEVSSQLYGLAFDLGLLEFSSEGSVTVGTGRAEELGSADYETSRDGSHSGRFTQVVGGVQGEWRASRQRLH